MMTTSRLDVKSRYHVRYVASTPAGAYRHLRSVTLQDTDLLSQVEATPPEELMFSWLKNGRALRSSERMVITQTDPDISPGTTNLDIIDLKFTDFGTYTCVAALKGGGIPEISIDVNISSTTGEPHTLCATDAFTDLPDTFNTEASYRCYRIWLIHEWNMKWVQYKAKKNICGSVSWTIWLGIFTLCELSVLFWYLPNLKKKEEPSKQKQEEKTL